MSLPSWIIRTLDGAPPVRQPQKRFLAALLLALLPGLILPWSAPSTATGQVAGTIAYVRGDTYDEIRLVESDGTGDRQLWSHGLADPDDVYEVWSLNWKHDATELTFASTHENWCSIHHSDIYVIGGDGRGYRRVTQGPACGALASYPKGTVRIPVENNSIFGDSVDVFLYFQGAPGVQQVSLPPGGSDVVVFEKVADFGEEWVQLGMLIDGPNRELAAATAVDVQEGATVESATVSVFTPSNPGAEPRSPTWRSDGSTLAFAAGFNQIMRIDPNPEPLQSGEALVAADEEMPDFVFKTNYGPTAATANQLLYHGAEPFDSGDGVYLITEGSSTSGERLVTYSEASEDILGLAWLPDGSGFVYTAIDVEDILDPVTNANMYEYSFASGAVTQRTTFTNTFAGQLSVSPDGTQIVFERAAALGEVGNELEDPELWIMNRDGTGLRLLVENGRSPAWSPAEPQSPPITPEPDEPLERKLFLPAVEP